MSQCQRCGGKSPDAFLCRQCESDLRDMLQNLAGRTATNMLTGESRPAAGWLELLSDAALGQTRLGESARRSGDLTSPMPCNLSASDLLDNVHNMLWKWVGAVNLATETLSLPGETR